MRDGSRLGFGVALGYFVSPFASVSLKSATGPLVHPGSKLGPKGSPGLCHRRPITGGRSNVLCSLRVRVRRAGSRFDCHSVGVRCPVLRTSSSSSPWSVCHPGPSRRTSESNEVTVVPSFRVEGDERALLSRSGTFLRRTVCPGTVSGGGTNNRPDRVGCVDGWVGDWGRCLSRVIL